MILACKFIKKWPWQDVFLATFEHVFAHWAQQPPRTNHSRINKSYDRPEVFTILSTLLKLLVKLGLIFVQ